MFAIVIIYLLLQLPKGDIVIRILKKEAFSGLKYTKIRGIRYAFTL